MSFVIIGAGGFLGKNLIERLSLEYSQEKIYAIDYSKKYFEKELLGSNANLEIIEAFMENVDEYKDYLKGADVVFHLFSSNMPAKSNCNIEQDIQSNVVYSASLLDACVSMGVKKVVFFSSGGTVYGKDVICPITEKDELNPISSYGLQKMMIEKLLYLYNHMYGLQYLVLRIANPFGKYQRPDGNLGAITKFMFQGINGNPIKIYGDGKTVRDYIYVDNVMEAVINLIKAEPKYNIYNIGSGVGRNLNEIIKIIESEIGLKITKEYEPTRKVDVPENYLNVQRYEREFGSLELVSFEEGIRRTHSYLEQVVGSEK